MQPGLPRLEKLGDITDRIVGDLAAATGFRGAEEEPQKGRQAMKVRAKFWVTDINHHHTGGGDSVYAEVKLAAVYGGGVNASWSKATPSGTITMGITNPDAIAAFELGKEYFVEFTEAAPAT